MEYTTSDYEEAQRALLSLIGKCEKAQTKLKEGTPQQTLLTRRIKAFYIALSLIERKLEKEDK